MEKSDPTGLTGFNTNDGGGGGGGGGGGQGETFTITDAGGREFLVTGVPSEPDPEPPPPDGVPPDVVPPEPPPPPPPKPSLSSLLVGPDQSPAPSTPSRNAPPGAGGGAPDWTTQTEWSFKKPKGGLFDPITSLDTGNRSLNVLLNKVVLPWRNVLADYENVAADIVSTTWHVIDNALEHSPLQVEYHAAPDIFALAPAMGIAVEAGPAINYSRAWLSTSWSTFSTNPRVLVGLLAPIDGALVAELPAWLTQAEPAAPLSTYKEGLDEAVKLGEAVIADGGGRLSANETFGEALRRLAKPGVNPDPSNAKDAQAILDHIGPLVRAWEKEANSRLNPYGSQTLKSFFNQ